MNRKLMVAVVVCLSLLLYSLLHLPLVKSQETTYNNVWEWEGYTTESSDSEARALQNPIDPFPVQDVIATCEITILSKTTAKFQEEMRNLGFTGIIVTKIEPHAWVETECYSSQQVKDWEVDYWHHWLHMNASVFFMSNQPMLKESPPSLVLDPGTWAALILVIKYILIPIVAGLVIYGIATHFIDTFFCNKQTLKTIYPNGTIVEQTQQTPSWEGGFTFFIGLGIIVFLGIAAYSIFYAGRPIRKRK